MKRQIPLYSVLLIVVAAVCVAVVVSCRVTIARFGDVAMKASAVENLLDKVFVDEYDKTAAGDHASAAIIASTGDRWSYYIPAEDYDAYLENAANTYSGIGVSIESAEGVPGLRIASVTAGGPAEAAGVLPGDVLLFLDGESVSGRPVTEVRDLIRAAAGRDIILGLDRNGEMMSLTVACGSVSVEVAAGAMLDDNVGYIRILNFEANCSRQTLDCISCLLQQGAKALVFDLRNNPGGKQTELVKILDYILPEGVLFRSADRSGKELVSESDELCLRMPMAVIVNEDSYSAAEFFAAALQEYDWAEVVGSKTVGKGNYQIVYQLFDGSACGVSAGRYYTPHGKSLDGTGVLPDLELAMDSSLMATVREGTVFLDGDTQLSAAHGLLLGMLLQK